jgi:hypothetical protein
VPIDENGVRSLVQTEVAKISDPRLKRALEACLVPPRPFLLAWDYGHPHKQFPEPRYPAFVVAEYRQTGTGFAYSEFGFGPTYPWGLINLERPGYGMDSGWFASLEGAFRESWAWDEPAPSGNEVD